MITITNSEYNLLQETKLCDSSIIESIRSSIVPTERLLDNLGYPIPVNHCYALRCYAYALGITYAETFKAE